MLAGQFRYAHTTVLRADTVNPVGLGMSKVCSEDSVQRAFAGADAKSCADWQLDALRKTWVLDLDVTVKPIYGLAGTISLDRLCWLRLIPLRHPFPPN